MLSSFLFSTPTTDCRWVSAGLRSARLCLTSSVSSVDSVLVDTSSRCTASRRSTSARNSTSRVPHQPDDVLVAGVEDLRRRSAGCRAASLIWPFLAATLVESRETPSRAAWNSSGVLRVRSASVVERLGQLVGVDPLGGLGEPREGLHDVVRRAGAVDRDLEPSGSWPEPAGSRLRYIAPSRVLTLMSARGLPAEVRVVLDPEGDLDVVPVELDLLDLADADAGDPDLVVGLEAAGLGEGGVVGVAAADDRQVLGVERGEDQQRHDGEADRPDDDGVAFAEGVLIRA